MEPAPLYRVKKKTRNRNMALIALAIAAVVGGLSEYGIDVCPECPVCEQAE